MAIKNDGVTDTRQQVNAIDYTAKRLAECVADYPFLQRCFESGTALVPVPRRSPLVEGALWPTLRICQAIRRNGLGTEILPTLVRTKTCTKSATAETAKGRPSPSEHYDTTEVRHSSLLPKPTRITLVDDVLTRGSTFVGMYARLKEAYPDAEINCFALIRTESPGEIESMLAPVEGTISFREPNRLQARVKRGWRLLPW